jgi:hypothetical protein
MRPPLLTALQAPRGGMEPNYFSMTILWVSEYSGVWML